MQVDNFENFFLLYQIEKLKMERGKMFARIWDSYVELASQEFTSFGYAFNQSSSNLTKDTPVKMSLSQSRCYLRPFLVPFELFLQTLCLDPLISSDHSSMDIFAFWSSCSQRLNKSFEIGSIIELGANLVLHHHHRIGQSKKMQKCWH